MNPVDEEAAKLVPTEDRPSGAVAGSHDELEEQLRQLDDSVEALLHSSPPSVPTEEEQSEMERRASRGFTRYLVALCIGVAVILAWELGWSPETKQMIAGWVQRLGWTKPPPVESKAAPVTQTAPETVTAKQPTIALDPKQIQPIEAGSAAVRQAVERQLANVRATVEQLAASQDKMAREIEKLADVRATVEQLAATQGKMAREIEKLADVRATVEQLAASQDKVAREIEKLQSANQKILEKIPTPPPKRPTPARKPVPPSSRAPIPPHLSPHP
jgi:uncharacterized membrane protein YccC